VIRTPHLFYCVSFSLGQSVRTTLTLARALLQRLSELDKVHNERAAKALMELPSPLEFLSFAFFHASAVIGPPFEARYYLDFVGRRQFVQAGLDAPPDSRRAVASCVLRAVCAYGLVQAASDDGGDGGG
jgi:hypothetical protein